MIGYLEYLTICLSLGGIYALKTSIEANFDSKLSTVVPFQVQHNRTN
jgi:hypothetical protein